PTECQKIITDRQAAVDDDQAEADLVRDFFVEELAGRGHDPERQVIWIPSRDVAVWVEKDHGRKATNEQGFDLPENAAYRRLLGRAVCGRLGTRQESAGRRPRLSFSVD